MILHGRRYELQVCVDKGSDDWEACFFEQLGDEDQEQGGDNEIDEDDEIEMDVEPPPAKEAGSTKQTTIHSFFP